ncbi:MAG: type VI secretion system ImpA family N-terminal domain-containing protein [Pseudomonadota bacterium]
MSLDWLADPVTEEEPCGPDLDATDDDDFVDYYFEAEARMPERYVVLRMSADGSGSADEVFDPGSVDLKEERRRIVALLQRSRDLRLLSLLARFSILAGDMERFAQAMSGIALVLETYPDAAHPAPSERRAVLSDLGASATVVNPLHHADLGGGAEATYRCFLVATGAGTARTDAEAEATEAGVVSLLSDSGFAGAVEKRHAALVEARSAFARIVSACLSNPSGPISPGFDSAVGAVDALLDLIHTARPDLATEADAARPPESAPADQAADRQTEDDDPPPVATPIATANVGGIADHGAARRALRASELYLAAQQPGSTARLLVSQARQLVGKSLVDALEVLLPQKAASARVLLGGGTGFVMGIDRLKALTTETPAPVEAEEHGDRPEIADLGTLDGTLRAVEQFYRGSEPASPIPLLLRRARQDLNKDFETILGDILPAEDTQK